MLYMEIFAPVLKEFLLEVIAEEDKV